MAHKVPFVIDVRIDFVCNAVITLIAIDTDIVRPGTHPQLLISCLEGSLPQP